jgi:hypothetical protein
VAQASTTPAFNNSPPFFHPEQGNKKDRNIVVNSLEICLKQAARRAPSGLVLKVNGFWLNPGYEKEHGIFPRLYGLMDGLRLMIEGNLLFLYSISHQFVP